MQSWAGQVQLALASHSSLRLWQAMIGLGWALHMGAAMQLAWPAQPGQGAHGQDAAADARMEAVSQHGADRAHALPPAHLAPRHESQAATLAPVTMALHSPTHPYICSNSTRSLSLFCDSKKWG